jgi:tRNA threonylcarbamoyladenosine biosynthesis protein TsaB
VLVLAWDTSTNATCLGLCRVNGLGNAEALITKTKDGRGGHSAILPPEIEKILKDRSLRPSDLDLVAVGRGPGSFTGLRTGLALAKGLAMGANIPALGLPSLAVLAGAQLGPGLVAPVIDARHQELFTVLYRLKTDSPLPEPISEILVLKPDQVLPTLRSLDTSSEGIRLCGPALAFLPPPIEGFSLGTSDPPDPTILAAQAAYWLNHDLASNCPVTPLYGRSPDIFKKWVPPTRLACRPS